MVLLLNHALAQVHVGCCYEHNIKSNDKNFGIKIGIKTYVFFFSGGKNECYSLEPSSCNKFRHCRDGSAYTKTCPVGLQWSARKNECDWPTEVQCGNRPITESLKEMGTGASGKPCTCNGGAKVGSFGKNECIEIMEYWST